MIVISGTLITHTHTHTHTHTCMYVTMWGNDMLINLTVGIISHTHTYIYVERDYKIMLYTLNAKHFIKECCIVIVNIICSKKKKK